MQREDPIISFLFLSAVSTLFVAGKNALFGEQPRHGPVGDEHGDKHSAVVASRTGRHIPSILYPDPRALASCFVLRSHDDEKDKGVPLTETLIHTLGYADDIVLLEYGDPTGLQRLSRRLSSISKGSRDDADTHICENRLIYHTLEHSADVVPSAPMCR